MSYTEWPDSEWNIFWQMSNVATKEEELLACWYSPDFCAEGGFGAGSLSYTEVVEFLQNPDWTLWEHMEETDHDILLSYMKEWVSDVDAVWSTGIKWI